MFLPEAETNPEGLPNLQGFSIKIFFEAETNPESLPNLRGF